MIPSVILSLVLIGMRMARRPFSRFLGLLICIVVGYAALVNGMIWTRQLASKSRPAQVAAAQYFAPGSFVRVGAVLVGAQSVDGDTLRRLIVVNPGAARGTPRLAAATQGTASVSSAAVSVTLAGRPAVKLSGPPVLPRSSVFAPDRATGYFLRDFGVLTADFERLLAGSLAEFFAACFALLFLCTASFVLLRLSRWPLLNVLLLVLAVRGYVALWHVLSVSVAPRIAGLVTDQLLARMFPSAVMAGLAVVLLLIDILFIPADRWRNIWRNREQAAPGQDRIFPVRVRGHRLRPCWSPGLPWGSPTRSSCSRSAANTR